MIFNNPLLAQNTGNWLNFQFGFTDVTVTIQNGLIELEGTIK